VLRIDSFTQERLCACCCCPYRSTGNSGGPALRGDVVVGVAFQNVPNADNIGYIIPLPVVRRFME
jgi:hypothetical protein